HRTARSGIKPKRDCTRRRRCSNGRLAAMDDVVTDEARGRFVSAGTVPCATCRNNVDPLRAARVAVFGDRFRYFCSAECRERYDRTAGRTPLPVPRRAMPRTDEITPDEAARIAARRTARALDEVESDGLAELSRRSSVPPDEPKPLSVAPPAAADVPAPT